MVEVFRPQDLQDAVEQLEFTDCTIFAGGTDLMVKKKNWAGLEPSFGKSVMLISDMRELTQIIEDEGFLVMGACCTFSQLLDSSLVPASLKKVFRQIASPGIRNSATLGGNICNSSPAGDSLPMLYALDARLLIASSCRRTELPIEDFILGPGKNLLKSGELIAAIKIPIAHFTTAAYKKVGTRNATALSKLSFAGLANLEKGELRELRIAFGAVAPTIVRSREIEKDILEQCQGGYPDIHSILEDYSRLIRPIDDQRSTALYRKRVALRLLEDFLLKISMEIERSQYEDHC